MAILARETKVEVMKDENPKIKLRWLEITRQYKQWCDASDSWVTSSYVDSPILQYFDISTSNWIDIPTVKEKRKIT